MRKTHTYFLTGLILLFGLVNACSKGPNLEGLLVGSWSVKRANIYSVHSFRHNGSWAEQERVEGKFSRIIENKEKVEGSWTLEYDKSLEKSYLVITPSTVGKDEKKWVVDQPFRFEVLTLNKDELVLQDENGQLYNWSRVRSSQADDEESVMGIAVVNPGPIIVNLKLDRAQDKFRYLCLDMELSVEDAEGLDYLVAESDPKTETNTYHLHPIVLDAAITYFSSLTYKDVKSLDKVKDATTEFKTIMAPYFDGRLTDVKINKVVVTAEPESVADFERQYAETYGLAPPENPAPTDQGSAPVQEEAPQ